MSRPDSLKLVEQPQTDGLAMDRSIFVLDQVKLAQAVSTGRGEIYLLTWLASVEQALHKGSIELVRACQTNLEQTLLRLIAGIAPTSPTTVEPVPMPRPGRPLRQFVARCFIVLYTRAETKTLFDTVRKLINALLGLDQPDQITTPTAGSTPTLSSSSGSGTVPKPTLQSEKEIRVAQLYLLGELMYALGQGVMSQFVDTILACQKLYRASAQPVVVRHAALVCLRKTLSMGALSLADGLARDLLKQFRSLLNDRSPPLQKAAAECLQAYHEATASLALSDLDATLSACFRALDAADVTTRRSIARLVSGLLAMSQIEGSAPRVEKTKKAASKDVKGADDDDEVAPPPAGEEATATLLTPSAMLAQLSTPYNKPSTTSSTRVALINIYAMLFTTLGQAYVEQYYADILRHLVNDLAGSVRFTFNRNEALATRKLIAILLRDVLAERLLSEQGQILAIGELTRIYLAKWPSELPGTTAPSKAALVLALGEVTGLLRQLGSAPSQIQSLLQEPLQRLAGHPSHSVQVAAAATLKAFCLAVPNQLESNIAYMREAIVKSTALLATPNASPVLARRAAGQAYAISALISIVSSKPLYVAFDSSNKCFTLSLDLLKASGAHELHISSVEIQVAWTILAALMTLGPSFVRPHLSQFQMLWKNALPKPTAKDMAAANSRSDTEWGFLLHIRECSLGSIYAFLKYNQTIMTSDISRKLVALLSNGFAFLNAFISQKSLLVLQQSASTSSVLRLVDREMLFRRRLLQCFAFVATSAAAEPLHAGLLGSCLAVIADPERFPGAQVESAIAAASANYTTVWEMTDGFAGGVTSLMTPRGLAIDAPEGLQRRTRLNRDAIENLIDEQLEQPLALQREFDTALLLLRPNATQRTEAPPPANGVVDAAIHLLARLVPYQDHGIQHKVIQQILNCINSPRLERIPARRMAILVNSTAVVLGALRRSNGVQPSRAHEVLTLPYISGLYRDVIKASLLHSDTRLRAAGSEALGRLCSIAGTAFMANQIQYCVSEVVRNTDPNGRAGCALAFGEIYSYVGGMAAGPVLKTIVDVLMSLSSDPHPTVHYWALESLSKVMDSAGLAYAMYTNATLGMLTRLYMQDSHEPEGGSAITVYLRGDLPAYQAFCRSIDAVIGVLGPELRESARVREIVLLLLTELAQDPDEGVIVEALKATQRFLIFAADHLDLAELVGKLRGFLAASRQPLRIAAVNSVYQLVQRDAASVSRLGGDKLVEELFALLDDDPTIDGVRDAIASWLRQTAGDNPSAWIDICQRIMVKSTATKRIAADQDAVGGRQAGLVDEESQGLGLEMQGPKLGGVRAAASSNNIARWRTQLFALECLHLVFVTLLRSGRREHFDARLAHAAGPTKRYLLINRVPDLIKMAFSASTAHVMEIRVEGLAVLRDVIENFRTAEDPDFADALLLEQYQAPIAAALTPAFAADSFPEVLSAGIQVCATFVGSGIIKEIDRMGRILKLLISALESCKDPEMHSMGEVQHLSSTAVVMLKTSIFAAWAEFQTASVKQPYLLKVITPYLAVLCPFWVASLREYAYFRGNPELATSDSNATADKGLTRDVALPYYENTWPHMLDAVGSLLRADSPEMIATLTGAPISSPKRAQSTAPTGDVHIALGLAFELLADGALSESQHRIAETCLSALEGLLRPSVSGDYALLPAVFNEICHLSYRIISTEDSTLQLRVNALLLSLTRHRRAGTGRGAVHINGNVNGSSDVSQMTQLLSVALASLSEAVPATRPSTSRAARQGQDVYVKLVVQTISFFLDIADNQSDCDRQHLYAFALEIYGRILRDEAFAFDLVPATLGSLQAIAARMGADSPSLLGFLAVSIREGRRLQAQNDRATQNKLKGHILASSLVLTSLSRSTILYQTLLDDFGRLMSSAANSETFEIASTASHCCRTIFTTALKSNTVLRRCFAAILPALIARLLRSRRIQESEGEVALAIDIIRTLALVASDAPANHRENMLAMVLPALVMLLDPDNAKAPLHLAAVKQIVDLAALDPLAFKQTTQGLTPDGRASLQLAVRQTMQGGHTTRAPLTKAAPTISLKAF
ncbi:uncharacterized protein L969DRAFT_15542 [Mixia osmundae IAM 14324]|uniref:LAA1-like C-terminal TPR repeats domain-containing protein n=1 Tax=Mixia osmundae (strain CBS 9802 / IAM 14324 / JCM 22182 / KY 12970) TaxID=764103 RepID=G7DYF8_MIXOS|nr:uncharacterized protein L969DRAFT_15542 [Mixia osmundae IAM 14324]KEI41520.1 hypothetical protein L969DRAFT_15542 [Mixia osmundae IAM 14324]GAA95618.1 hypothetical protein E5Q_02274 [Mixia osmundae IAM 14324]